MADNPANMGQNNDWREKYLSALDTQEALEKQLARQEESLRRALLRISLCADGQDDALDEALDHLRDHLRLAGVDILPALAPLDDALRHFEDRREETRQGIAEGLGHTITALQKLPLSSGLKKDIRHYLDQLPQRTRKIHLYPALLQQLAEIQRQAIEGLQQPGGRGLWQKLLGTPAADLAEPVAEAAEPGAIESTSLPGLKPPADDSRLVGEITRLLRHLLEGIDVPESLKPGLEAIQTQLAAGLKADQVLATLESVRDLVMEAYLTANKAFATYLNDVNLELADIYAVLGGAMRHQADRLESSQSLRDSMMEQMASLESGTANATNLDQLKHMVQSQLGNIREALQQFQQTEQGHQQLAHQLQELGDKIKAMEVEAEKNRTTLEKQRYKALHDPLTELPNREAYNERIQTDFQRWKRYRHPLSIAVCDLDHFKKINDSLGHQAGDKVLKVISRSIAKRLRAVDFFGRYGGEEFVVVMPETTADQAFTVLEKIRAAIADTDFNYKAQPLAITLSLGITQFREDDTIETAFARADEALYAAKAQGRNCTHLA